MLNRFLFSVLLALIYLSSAQIRAEETKELVALTAGADPWPPYIDQSLPKGGVSVQIADAALRTQGYTVQNKILPWSRALEEVKQARVDLILDAWWSQERSEHFLYSRPYINGPVKFIRRKSEPFTYEDLSSLNGKSLVMVRDYAYGEALMSAKNYTRYQAHNFMQGIQMLVRNRVDLAVENELVARTRIAQESPELLKQLVFVDNPLSDNYVYLIVSYKHPKHQEIIGAFNRGLDIILKNGVYQEILKANNLVLPKMFESPSISQFPDSAP